MTRVRTGVDVEIVNDVIAGQGVVQLRCIYLQVVRVADVDRNRAVLPQVLDVLVDKSQGRIRGPSRQYSLLVRADRQVEVQRRVVRVRGPGRSRGQLRTQAEGQLRRIGGRLDRRERFPRSPDSQDRFRAATGSTGS